MKRILIYSIATLFFTTVTYAQGTNNTQNESAQSATKESIKEVSYAFGIDVGNTFKNFNIENFDIEQFIVGFKAIFADNGQIDIQKNGMIIQKFMQQLQVQKIEQNKIAGEEFLAKNKTVQGVVTTESGLQYKIEKEGTGAYPTAESTVLAHYSGMLIDGREFDSSYKRNEPTTFSLNGVIKGWAEGLQKIKEGGKIKLFIPQELAYGEKLMQGTIIEPYSALVFEIELIKIVK